MNECQCEYGCDYPEYSCRKCTYCNNKAVGGYACTRCDEEVSKPSILCDDCKNELQDTSTDEVADTYYSEYEYMG